MADIDLVIRIPEEIYKALQDIDAKYEDNVQTLLEAIANGTPLPKGHDDLIDVDKLRRAFIIWGMSTQGIFTEVDILSIIQNSYPIIKADKTESEEKKL